MAPAASPATADAPAADGALAGAGVDRAATAAALADYVQALVDVTALMASVAAADAQFWDVSPASLGARTLRQDPVVCLFALLFSQDLCEQRRLPSRTPS